MKRILISTIVHWTSVGSILQAVALQKALKKFSAVPQTITFKKDENLPAINRIVFDKNIFIRLINFTFQILRFKRLVDFKQKTIGFYKKFLCCLCLDDPSGDNFKNLNADLFIAGSDQIWNPNNLRHDYFLEYASLDKPRITYAASMGISKIPLENESLFSSFLNNLTSISVRESDLVPTISKYTHNKVYCHLDPAFLIDIEEWRSYSSEYKIKKPYIFLYPIYWDKKLNQQIRDLHKKTNLPILSFQRSFRNIYSNKILSDINPGQFLWLVDNSEAVITSSFHGTAFSIIFQKKVFPIINPKAPSRIQCLLETLRFNPPKTILDLMTHDFNYSVVNERIIEERQRSFDYLKRFIDD